MGEFTTKSLYEVIKPNLLMKDKDLMHFIRVMNDNILYDFQKIKNNKLNVDLILDKYENYAIVFMTIKSIMKTYKISNTQDMVKEISDMFLDDLLEDKSVIVNNSKFEDED